MPRGNRCVRREGRRGGGLAGCTGLERSTIENQPASLQNQGAAPLTYT